MAIPADKISDRYSGPVGTLSPLAHINYLVQIAKKTWNEEQSGNLHQGLAFDAITKLIISLELDDASSKDAVCKAISFLLARLDSNFYDDHLKPMLQMQEMRAVEKSQRFEGGDMASVGSFSWQSSDIMEPNMYMADEEALAISLAQKAAMRPPRFYISPNSWARVGFDVCVLMIVLIDSLIMPFQIAYHFDNMEEGGWFWFGTLIFTADIVANFFTGYIAGPLQKDHGQVVISRRRIVINYLKTWFTIDFFSTFPWSSVVQALATSGSDGVSGTRVAKVAKIVKLARFMRLARMLKLLKLQNVWDAMENSIGNVFAVQVLNLIKVIAIVVYICHWNACIWWAIGATSSIFNMNGEDDVRVEKWTLRQFNNVFRTTDGVEWTKTYSWSDDNISAAEKYMFCFYWTLGVMRTMPVEVFPVNRTERLYTLIFMFFAFSLFSICISRITQMYNKINVRRSEFDENLAAVRFYMHEHDIEKDLQNRVKTYLEYRFSRRRIFAKENDMFKELTETLRTELKCATFVRTLRGLWIFKDLASADLKPIVLICSVEEAAPGDLLSQANTVALQASVSMSGALTSVDPNAGQNNKFLKKASAVLDVPNRKATSKPNMTVDVDCLLFTNATLSSASMWAFEFCDLAVIVKADFLHIRRTQPKLNFYLENLAKSSTGQDILSAMKKRDKDAGFDANQDSAEPHVSVADTRISRQRQQLQSQYVSEDRGDGGAVVQALG